MSSEHYFLLMYEVAQDYVERRVAYRKEHLELATEFADKGVLLLAGALEDPIDGAVLAFRTADAKVVEDFARKDPYVRSGIVTKWTVRKWKVVAGCECTNPIRPADL